LVEGGDGVGEGEGELRESRDKVEPTIIVVADDEEDNKERKQNTGGLVRAQESIPSVHFYYLILDQSQISTLLISEY